MTAAAAETHAAHGQSRNARRRLLHSSLRLQQDAVLRPYNPQLPNIVSELRGKSPPPAPTAVPLQQLLRVPLSLPPLFLRGERHFHGCFTCSRHASCHFAARECRLLHNSRGPPLIGCLPYASVSSGFQFGHLDTSPGASLRSFSVALLQSLLANWAWVASSGRGWGRWAWGRLEARGRGWREV